MKLIRRKIETYLHCDVIFMKIHDKFIIFSLVKNRYFYLTPHKFKAVQNKLTNLKV